MSQWAVELPGHSAHLVHAYKTLIVRSRRELAATAMVIVHLSSSVIAFIGLLGGLFALGTYPIEGVLLTLGAMERLQPSLPIDQGAATFLFWTT